MKGSKIVRSNDLRAENRHRILQSLRTEGPLSRAEIGKLTGLSQAALSAQFGFMIERGIATSENTTEEVLKRGRPKTTVALNPDAATVVTVALTIDQIRFSVVNYAGETLSQATQQIQTRALDAKQLFDAITAGVNTAMSQYGIEKLAGIGIGFQGVTDVDNGELLWSPILSIKKVPISAMLKKRFSVPVSVNNDCGLIARALYLREKDTLGDSFAAVLFSHGIGLGLYLSGKPFTGAQSSALELGHVQFEKNGALCRCGKRGCIEAYAAKYGIVRAAARRPILSNPSKLIDTETFDQLTKSATNDQQQRAAFEMAGKAIGFGLATVFTLLDTLPVALIGHKTNAINLMMADIENELKAHTRSTSGAAPVLHCYDDETPLLLDGLVLESMAMVDRVFADIEEDSLHESELK